MRAKQGGTESLAHVAMGDGVLQLQRALLKDQATDLLRDHIVSGRLPPGGKLVERDVAELLGISRAPVRDALIQLETEGLVVTKPNGRHVVELNDRDIRELHQVRSALEKLAVELAAQSITPDNRQALVAKLRDMQEAIGRRDRLAYIKSDVDLHRLIWQQAGNSHLYTILNSMAGRIAVSVSSNAEFYDWEETLAVHEELVNCINAGDAPGAINSVAQHMANALRGALEASRGVSAADDSGHEG